MRVSRCSAPNTSCETLHHGDGDPRRGEEDEEPVTEEPGGEHPELPVLGLEVRRFHRVPPHAEIAAPRPDLGETCRMPEPMYGVVTPIALIEAKESRKKCASARSDSQTSSPVSNAFPVMGYVTGILRGIVTATRRSPPKGRRERMSVPSGELQIGPIPPPGNTILKGIRALRGFCPSRRTPPDSAGAPRRRRSLRSRSRRTGPRATKRAAPSTGTPAPRRRSGAAWRG